MVRLVRRLHYCESQANKGLLVDPPVVPGLGITTLQSSSLLTSAPKGRDSSLCTQWPKLTLLPRVSFAAILQAFALCNSPVAGWLAEAVIESKLPDLYSQDLWIWVVV